MLRTIFGVSLLAMRKLRLKQSSMTTEAVELRCGRVLSTRTFNMSVDARVVEQKLCNVPIRKQPGCPGYDHIIENGACQFVEREGQGYTIYCWMPEGGRQHSPETGHEFVPPVLPSDHEAKP